MSDREEQIEVVTRLLSLIGGAIGRALRYVRELRGGYGGYDHDRWMAEADDKWVHPRDWPWP